MLIAVVCSYLRRVLVGLALFGVASPCWQHCFLCVSALVGFSCISFPGRIKGEIEGKNDWKVPLSLCPFIDFPDQVTSSACSGTLVAAASLVTFYAMRKAFLAAAAFVLSFFGAAAASCCVSSAAAVGKSRLANGFVLRLRFLCAACATEMVVHARVMLGFLDSLFALDGMVALESDGLDRQVLAGSLFSGTGEQASGRVDVPGKDIQLQAWFLDRVSRPRKGFKCASSSRNSQFHQSHLIALSWFAPCRDVHWSARSLLDLLWTIWNAAFRNTQRFRALLSS